MAANWVFQMGFSATSRNLKAQMVGKKTSGISTARNDRTRILGQIFQSHYFHREREAAPSPSDPFADCIKADNAEMRKLLDTKIAHKTLDFSYIRDDPLINSISSLPEHTSSTKDMLMKRFNYHSERVLLTTVENEMPIGIDFEGQPYEESMKTNKPKLREDDENDIILESEELRSDQREEQLDLISFTVDDAVRSTKRYTDEQAQTYRDTVLRVCEAMPDNEDYDDDSEDDSGNDYEDLLKLATAATQMASAKCATLELTATDMVDLQAIHDSVAELLKHFWMCFPPTNPDMDEKLAHCRQMLSFAYTRYDSYLQKKKK
ncbi:BSD domain-containing protein [Dirofilaria immitis]|nr:BSD domain-containing protein [Dirofilaria immitis]